MAVPRPREDLQNIRVGNGKNLERKELPLAHPNPNHLQGLDPRVAYLCQEVRVHHPAVLPLLAPLREHRLQTGRHANHGSVR